MIRRERRGAGRAAARASFAWVAAALAPTSPVVARESPSAALWSPRAGVGQDAPPPRAPSPRSETAARAAPGDRQAARAALERGLAWLAAEAAKTGDGSISVAGAEDPAPVAVTALAALAWMAGGSIPGRGPQGREVAAAVDWLAARAELDPEARSPGFIGLQGDRISRMHGHGFATLALASAWSMSPRTRRGEAVGRALRAAVACIEKSQGVEGGWWYEPRKGLEHEGSITICSVQALRAAHGAGIDVDPVAIARAVDYVGRLQKEDGSFRYALGDEWSTPALTAAGLATLNASGKYEGRPIEEGHGFLARRLALREAERSPGRARDDPRLPGEIDEKHVYCRFYERLCIAQALWQAPERGAPGSGAPVPGAPEPGRPESGARGPRAFEEWAARESAIVLGSRREDGSWRDRRFGDAYATAMNCLFLALPEGVLPLFQR